MILSRITSKIIRSNGRSKDLKLFQQCIQARRRSPQDQTQVSVLSRRNHSNKSNSNGNKNNAPKMTFDPQQGNSILHEKAARAAELNAELNALLETQAKRRADEANRPFGSSFIDFVKTSRSQLINIFASFTCVLLAYQIVQIRKGAKKLLDNARETNDLMTEYKNVMKVISSDEFQQKICKLHERELKRRSSMVEGLDDNGGGGGGWLSFGRQSSSDDKGGDGDASLSQTVLSGILRTEVSKVIGDRALTETELEDKKLMELQREMGIVQRAQQEKLASKKNGKSSSVDASSNNFEQFLIDVQSDGNGNDGAVVKRSKRGFI